MFEFFRGSLTYAAPTKVVIDVSGVGYAVQVSLKTYQKLPQIGADIFIYVASVIRENDHTLYGFLTIEEKNLFHHLTSVSGIGPKTAINILGHVDVDEFQLAILQANGRLLSKIPGVGKKTAERLIVELKDKFQSMPSVEAGAATFSKKPSLAADAVSALINLGYHPFEAQNRVKKVLSSQKEILSLSELITTALKS